MSELTHCDREWVVENHDNMMLQGFGKKALLFRGQSEFQKVEVFETHAFGKIMFLDELVMLTEKDEFIYHDMISHVALNLYPNPKRVLIIGGGDGGTLREVLRYPEIERCVMVEIDGMVLDVAKKFFPTTSCAMDDPRGEILVDDGVKFVAETKEQFDIVIIDSTDPIGAAKPLFGDTFYGNVARILSADGIAIAQGESPFFNPKMQRVISENMGKHFNQVHFYNYSNIGYPSGFWSFALASKQWHPVHDFKGLRHPHMDYQYYNEAIHRAAFALPTFQQKFFT